MAYNPIEHGQTEHGQSVLGLCVGYGKERDTVKIYLLSHVPTGAESLPGMQDSEIQECKVDLSDSSTHSAGIGISPAYGGRIFAGTTLCRIEYRNDIAYVVGIEGNNELPSDSKKSPDCPEKDPWNYNMTKVATQSSSTEESGTSGIRVT